MDKIVVGIPRGFFNEYHNFWQYYFNNLGIDVVFSKPTDNQIVELGMKYANDEMCMSLKTFLGHVAYLEDKCDYLLIPRINNYGVHDQMCTNFMAIYDIVHNLFDKPILNYNIDYTKKETEEKGLRIIGNILGKSEEECNRAYQYARVKDNKDKKRIHMEEYNKLNTSKKKILVVGHSYVCHDRLVGKPIIDYLQKQDCEIIFADKFSSKVTNSLSSSICRYLYWKHNKELVGAIELCKNKIDGIILLSTFPCGPDSLVNELVLRRVSKPILNLIVDDVNSLAGIETRIESFLDILYASESS